MLVKARGVFECLIFLPSWGSAVPGMGFESSSETIHFSRHQAVPGEDFTSYSQAVSYPKCRPLQGWASRLFPRPFTVRGAGQSQGMGFKTLFRSCTIPCSEVSWRKGNAQLKCFWFKLFHPAQKPLPAEQKTLTVIPAKAGIQSFQDLPGPSLLGG